MGQGRRPAWSEAITTLLLLLLLQINPTSAQKYGYPFGGPAVEESLGQFLYSTMFSTGNELYVYGGIDELHNNGSNLFSRFSFDMANQGRFEYENITSGGYQAFSAKSVLVNNDTAIIFITDVTSFPQPVFRVAEYTISSNTWLYPNTTAYSPVVPDYFDATLASDGRVYLTGGLYFNGSDPIAWPFTEIWSYDPGSHTFQNRTSQYQSLVRHTGVALPDGNIVYLGGFILTNYNATHQNLTLATIYTPSTDSWTYQNLTHPTQIPQGVQLPEVPCSFNAILGPEKRYIYVYGGDSDQFYRYIYRYNTLLVLDTQTWTWFVPDVKGTFPSARSFPTSALLYDKYFVLYGGYDWFTTYYSELDVLLLPPQSATDDFNPLGFKWIVNLTTDATYAEQNPTSSSSLSTADKVGAIIGSIIALIIIGGLLFCFRTNIRRFMLTVHYSFWEPRTGEPLWTETLRLITRFILLFLFIAFFVILVYQVTGSAKTSSIMYETSADGSIAVPDVRVCTEGYDSAYISCITASGIVCDQYLHPLDMSLHKPYYAGNYPNTTCYLFMPPPDFTLSENILPGLNHGWKIYFYVSIASPATAGYTHITLYPNTRDPNRYVYLNQPQGFTDDEIYTWENADGNDFTAANILDLEHFSIGAIHYQLVEYRSLVEGDDWNYVGFKQHRISTDDINTEVHASKLYLPDTEQQALTPAYFTVEPMSYKRMIYQEQYIHQLVNTVGYLGGVFGFFVVFQELMFGYRPRSPWGVVHRWSTGNLKRSISRNLRSRFDSLHTPVPLVNPVHRRFTTLNVRRYGRNSLRDDDDYSDRESSVAAGLMGAMETTSNKNNNNNNTSASNNSVLPVVGADDNDRTRIELVEERIQLLELLFKSYYVNDEIFRRLDKILRQRPEYDDRQPSVTTNGVVDRLFRRRPNSESLDDDATSTLGMPTPIALDESEPMRSIGHHSRPAATTTSTDRDVERWAQGVSSGVSSVPWDHQSTSLTAQHQQIHEKPPSSSH